MIACGITWAVWGNYTDNCALGMQGEMVSLKPGELDLNRKFSYPPNKQNDKIQ
jgi:hypothetical protein